MESLYKGHTGPYSRASLQGTSWGRVLTVEPLYKGQVGDGSLQWSLSTRVKLGTGPYSGASLQIGVPMVIVIYFHIEAPPPTTLRQLYMSSRYLHSSCCSLRCTRTELHLRRGYPHPGSRSHWVGCPMFRSSHLCMTIVIVTRTSCIKGSSLA